MRSTNFQRQQEQDIGAIESTSDPAVARDPVAAEDVTDFDQSLPVPWEWWTASPGN